MTMSDVSDAVAGVDARVLGELSHGADVLVAVASADAQLRSVVLKFQLEQAADKAAYAAQGAAAERMPHLLRVLLRMCDLALATAQHVLQRTHTHAQQQQQQQRASHTGALDRSRSAVLQSSSSVEDFVEGSEGWLESGALLLHTAVDVLSHALLAHAHLRRALQDYLLHQHHVLDYFDMAFAVTREQELAYFQEGYRTAHLRLLANLVADHAASSVAVAQHRRLLPCLLASTRLDADNPGAAEWAAFALRNVCSAAPEAQAAVRQLATSASRA